MKLHLSLGVEKRVGGDGLISELRQGRLGGPPHSRGRRGFGGFRSLRITSQPPPTLPIIPTAILTPTVVPAPTAIPSPTVIPSPAVIPA